MKLLIASCLLLFRIPVSATPVDAVVMEAKMRDIRLESFKVEGLSLAECIGSLKKRTDQLQTESAPPTVQPFSFILVPPAAVPDDAGNHPPVTVSYEGKDVTLETILREIAKTANQDVFLTSAGVIITPKGLPPFPNPQSEKGEIFRKVTGEGVD